jgi:hypothetical protein
MRRRRQFACPNCGEPVNAGALACRACGSDAETGWRAEEELEAAAMDLPAPLLSEDEYEEVLVREGLVAPAPPPRRAKWPAWMALGMILAIVLSVAMAILW